MTKSLKYALFSLVPSLLLLFVTGCMAVNSTERSEPRSNPNVVKDSRVQVDPTLYTKARVIEVREGVVGNGDLLKIQVEIYNGWRKRQFVNYRFDWVDDSGLTIDSPLSRWSPLDLAGKESKWVSAVAPTPRAVDFRFKLIESDD